MSGLDRIILVRKETLDRMESYNLREHARGIKRPVTYDDDRDFVTISVSESHYQRLIALARPGEPFDPDRAISLLLDGLDAIGERIEL